MRAQTCISCGEPLTLECEENGKPCMDCVADAAKVEFPEPFISRLQTRAEIDAMCGVTHRRRAS